MEGMVIVKGNFDSIKLINVTARKLLGLPFADSDDSPEFFKTLRLSPIELLGGQNSEEQKLESIHRSAALVTFETVVSKSLEEKEKDKEEEKSNMQIYELKTSLSPAAKYHESQDSLDSNDEEK